MSRQVASLLAGPSPSGASTRCSPAATGTTHRHIGSPASTRLPGTVHGQQKPPRTRCQAAQGKERLVSRKLNASSASQAGAELEASPAEGFVSQPQFLALNIAAFLMIAFDVFGPSAHLLANIDNGAHDWVTSNVPVGVSLIGFERYMSDSAILLSCAGWVVATGIAMISDPFTGLRRTAITTAVYLAPGFSTNAGDVPLIAILKDIFRRSRPSLTAIHSTYSFPSGHTNCAVYLLGALLFILLPGAIGSLKDTADATSATADAAVAADLDTASPAEIKANKRITGKVLTAFNSVSPFLWVAGGAVTAAGRVLGNAHWATDTLAGACVGAGLVSVAAMLDRLAAEASARYMQRKKS